MGGMERDMVRRVPVFRSNFESEGKAKKMVDGGDDISGSSDGQRSGLLGCQ